MGQDSLDQIKDMLINHEVSIDNDKLWQGINRKQSGVSRKLIISSTAITLLLLTIGGLGYYFGTMHASSDGVESIKQYEESGKLSSTAAINNTSENEESTTKVAIDSRNASKQNKKIDVTTSPFAQAKKIHSNDSRTKNTVQTQKALTQNQQNTATTQPFTTATNSINNQNVATASSEGIEMTHVLGADTDAVALRSGHAIKVPYASGITGIAFENLMLDNYRPLPSASRLTEIECYDYRGKRNALSIVTYASLDVAMKRLSAASESSDYLNERKSTESRLIGYHAGVQLKYLLENGLYIKGGIEYGQIRERFAHRKTTETTEIRPNQIIQIDIQPNGDTTIIYGNAPVTVIEMKNWRVGNTYKTLDFTALLGYQMNQGDWIYSGELGASYNTRFRFKGLILDELSDPVDAAGYFKDRINWSILGAINLGYKMNGRTTLFTGLNFRHILDPVNSISNVISQKYTNIGIHAGIEFKLN